MPFSAVFGCGNSNNKDSSSQRELQESWSCNVFQEMFIYKINGLMYIFREEKINLQQKQYFNKYWVYCRVY